VSLWFDCPLLACTSDDGVCVKVADKVSVVVVVEGTGIGTETETETGTVVQAATSTDRHQLAV